MDFTQVLILVFAIFYIGFIIYTRKGGNFKEFSVANRNIGGFLVFATICATYIGPAMTLGFSRDGASNGYSLILLSCISTLGLFLGGWIFAARIREKFSDAYSIGDVIAHKSTHNHPAVKVTVGFFSLLMLGSIFIVISYAGGELINNIFGFSKIWSIAIMTSIVILYSAFGGIRATIQTDAIQFVNFIVIIPLLALIIFFRDDFSFSSYLSQSSAKAETVFNSMNGMAIFGTVFFWFITSTGLDAALVGRFLSSEKPKIAKRSTMWASIFLLFWTILMVFIGDAGQMLLPDLEVSDQSLLIIAKAFLPEVFYGIFIIAMIGVVMSTQDSALNTSCILFSEDIAGGLKPNMTDKQKLLTAKLITVVLGIAAILIAGLLTSVLQSIIFILSHSITVLLPITVFSVLVKNPNWKSAIPTMMAGLMSQLLWENFVDSALPSTLIGLACGSLVYFVLHKSLKPA